jgi:hypothetical protein
MVRVGGHFQKIKTSEFRQQQEQRGVANNQMHRRQTLNSEDFAGKERKFKTKIKEKQKKETDAFVEKIIPESEINEHTKNIDEQVLDIYKYTDTKVQEVQTNLLRCYNQKQSNKLDISRDREFEMLLENNISLPLQWQPKLSLQDALLSEAKLRQKERELYEKVRPPSGYEEPTTQYMDPLQRTQLYLNTPKLSTVKNSFVEFKSLYGGAKVPRLKLEKHQKSKDDLHNLIEKSYQMLALPEVVKPT